MHLYFKDIFVDVQYHLSISNQIIYLLLLLLLNPNIYIYVNAQYLTEILVKVFFSLHLLFYFSLSKNITYLIIDNYRICIIIIFYFFAAFLFKEKNFFFILFLGETQKSNIKHKSSSSYLIYIYKKKFLVSLVLCVCV